MNIRTQKAAAFGHFILDRFSCEVFIGEGETVMTHRIVTDLSADRISFNAIGSARFDIRGCSLAG